MFEDWLGNEVTAESAATVQAIDDFVHGFVAYETKAVNILPAADADPDCALANAYAAMLYMFLESREAPALARPYLERAEATVANATPREQMATAAVRAWVDNDIPQAVRLCDETAAQHPRELATVKAGQYHQFNLGNAAGMLRLGQAIMDANQDLAYAHGVLAFGQEQCHLLDEAETSARRAIELERKEPWAHHALAHVMLTQGRLEEGREFMAEMQPTWTDLNSFMSTHNWWHTALFDIALGDHAKALSIYDDHCWGLEMDYSQDQIGAVSLLARLELVGVDVGERWAEVANYLKPRINDHVQPFLTMQYVYGLARAGLDEADQMVSGVTEFARTAPEFQRTAWRDVCVPACRALRAHAIGDFATAVSDLGSISHRLEEIGGSHAQRDLFVQILADARRKAS